MLIDYSVSEQDAVDSLIRSLREWLVQLIWYPGCEVTDVSQADSGWITCRIQGGTNQRCGWRKQFTIAIGDYVDVLYDPRTMAWEIFKPGGATVWSTTNFNVDQDSIRFEYTNSSTGTLVLGEVVVFDSGIDEAVNTTTTSGDTRVAGAVVVGNASGSLVQVAQLGFATVLVDQNVARGQFLKTSSARGFAEPTASLEQGVFGVALTANGSGSSGTVTAFIAGHSWDGAGVGGGNTLDQAYDQGGAGVGRIITADSGAVEIQNTGGLLSQGNIVLDDGIGDSPQIQLVGGSNDDTTRLYLDDDAVAGRSDVIMQLPGNTDQCELQIQDSVGGAILQLRSNGDLIIPSGGFDVSSGNFTVNDSSGPAGAYTVTDAATNTVTEVLSLRHIGGAVVAGFGARLSFELENGAGAIGDSAYVDAVWDDASGGSEDSRIAFGVRVGGAVPAEMCRVDGAGILMASGKIVDLAGNADALVLDNDGDTTISAPTDDQIDFEAGGSDIAHINATGLVMTAGNDITMPNGTWAGLGAAAARVEFFTDEVSLTDCNVGVGMTPGAGRHMAIGDGAVSTTVAYAGLYAAHTKTAGATDHDDDFTGADFSATLNQSGGEIGHLSGVKGTATVTDGSVGDAVNVRSVYGGRFNVESTGGTVTSVVIGFYCPVGISGGTVSGNVFGFQSFADLNSGTVNGNVYGGFITVDDDIGAGGTVYDLYLWELTGVDYGIYQNGTADNVFGGHILPSGNKAKNLGAAGNRWNTLYQGTSTAAGTSRLMPSKKDCPVCNERMVRGTGSLCVLGEDRDFVLAHCLNCGNVAMEELQHLPTQMLSQRAPPPHIKFKGFHVFEMSGNSRSVRVDFQYTDDEVEPFVGPDGEEREIRTSGITNSTYLSDTELETFLSMSKAKKRNFLLALGQREWEALEDIKLMQEECVNLQTTLNNAVSDLQKRNLLDRRRNRGKTKGK